MFSRVADASPRLSVAESGTVFLPAGAGSPSTSLGGPLGWSEHRRTYPRAAL